LHCAHSDGEGGHRNLKCCVDCRESSQVGSSEDWSCDGDDGGGIAGDLVVVGVLCDPRVDLGADADEACRRACVSLSLGRASTGKIPSGGVDQCVHLGGHLAHLVRVVAQGFQFQLQSVGVLLTRVDDVTNVVLILPALSKGGFAGLCSVDCGSVVRAQVTQLDLRHGCGHVSTWDPTVASSCSRQVRAGVRVVCEDVDGCVALCDLALVVIWKVAGVARCIDIVLTILQSN